MFTQELESVRIPSHDFSQELHRVLSKKRILVVDDEAFLRKMVGISLQGVAKSVTEAPDGQRALALMAAQDFDIIFLDLNMPNMDGIATLREMRARGIQTPVVIMSAFISPENLQDCVREKVAHFVAKPATVQRLQQIASGEFLDSQPSEFQNLVSHVQEGDFDAAYEVASHWKSESARQEGWTTVLARVVGLKKSASDSEFDADLSTAIVMAR